ncbi:MAG: hypothetical protein ABSC55_13680 [Syntrophorhabdales bacterium]|jgi:cobalt/nickel transport protein
MDRLQKRLWIGLLVMTLLSPLGIILPRVFRAEGAWAEWTPGTLTKLLGYLPEGLRRTAETWRAPMAQYSLNADNQSLFFQIGCYVLSGLLGLVLVVFLIYVLSRFLFRHAR